MSDLSDTDIAEKRPDSSKKPKGIEAQMSQEISDDENPEADFPSNDQAEDKMEDYINHETKLEVMSNHTELSNGSIGMDNSRFSTSGFSSDSFDNYVGESVIEGTPNPYSIIQAAKKGDIGALTKLVIKGSNINAQNSEGQTALHFAVINGNIDCTAAILAFDDTDINIADVVGNSPLHIACKNVIASTDNMDRENNEETPINAIANMLISDKRTDLNALDGGMLSPVIISTILGNISVLSKLVQNGADVNLSSARIPALYVACDHGFTQIVHLLLQYNAKSNCRDSRGYTPLHIACERAHLDIVKLLIEYGANPNLELPTSRLKPYQLTNNEEITFFILGKQTSISHPLRIDYIECDELGQGSLGISMCPGRNKKIHRRSADLDIEELVKSGTQVLVSLIRNSELRAMGIPDLLEKVSEAGVQVVHAPIRDKWIPRSMDFLTRLVNQIVELIRSGRRVVVHCNGGKGRSGLVVVATLVALGIDTGKATDIVRATKHGMLYNPAQILYLKAFKIAIRSMRSKSSKKVQNELKELSIVEDEDDGKGDSEFKEIGEENSQESFDNNSS